MSPWISLRRKSTEFHVDGFVLPGFEPVCEAFRKNFRKGLEKEGSTFAVYYKGELVVDLYGGYADQETKWKWDKDTLAVAMSGTKGVTALIMAMAVDRGLLDYDELVTKYWPEFGQNGKENITVRELLSHQAGLAAVDEDITFDIIPDWKRVGQILESQKPNWTLGQGIYGYHSITFGFLADQLLRRVDPQQRSIGKFLADEITSPHGIEFYIGMPESEAHRRATIKNYTAWELFIRMGSPSFKQASYNFKVSGNKKLVQRSTTNPPLAKGMDDQLTYTVEIPAANGVGNARGLARIFSLIAEGKLLSKEIISKISQPVYGLDGTPDYVYGCPVVGGYGFKHTKNPDNEILFGHPGYGGQNVKVDVQKQLAFAYIRNGFEPETGDSVPTFMALQNSIYASLKAMK